MIVLLQKESNAYNEMTLESTNTYIANNSHFPNC